MKVSSAAFAGIKPSVKSSLIRCKKVCIAIFTESAQDFGHQRHVSRWHAHVPGPLSYLQGQDGRCSLQTAPEADWRPLLDEPHPLILQLPMPGSQSIVASELRAGRHPRWVNAFTPAACCLSPNLARNLSLCVSRRASEGEISWKPAAVPPALFRDQRPV